MSAIDPAALAAARERLNARLERASKAADFVDASVADLRIVLDALREARKQAFEEAKAQARSTGRMVTDGITHLGRYELGYERARSDIELAIEELAAKEQS